MKLALKAVQGLVIRGGNLGISFLASILLARLTTPAGVGAYALGLSLVNLLIIPSQFGLGTIITREVAKEKKNRVRVFEIIELGQKASFCIWLGTFTLFAGAIYTLSPAEPTKSILYISALICLPYAVSATRSAAMRGLNAANVGLLPEQIIRPLLFLCGLAIPYFCSHKISADDSFRLQAFAGISAYFVGQFLLRQRISRILPSSDAQPENDQKVAWKIWLKGLGPLTVIAAAQILTEQSDIIMLSALSGTFDTGIYKVSSQLALLTNIGMLAVTGIIAPEIARAHRDNDWAAIKQSIDKAKKFSLGIAIPVWLCLTLGGPEILSICFGSAFRAAWIPMIILASGLVILASTGPAMTLATMTGLERLAAKQMAISAAMNITLNLLLIPGLGAIGAAIATAASQVYWKIALTRALDASIEKTPLKPDDQP